MATSEKDLPVLDNGNVSPPAEIEKQAILDNRFRDLPPDPDEGLSPEEKAKIDRQLLWRLDLKLIPWLCLLYLISFLDRTCMLSYLEIAMLMIERNKYWKCETCGTAS